MNRPNFWKGIPKISCALWMFSWASSAEEQLWKIDHLVVAVWIYKKGDNNHRCCELDLSAALPPASPRTAELLFGFVSIRKGFQQNHVCFSGAINIKRTQKSSVAVTRRGGDGASGVIDTFNYEDKMLQVSGSSKEKFKIFNRFSTLLLIYISSKNNNWMCSFQPLEFRNDIILLLFIIFFWLLKLKTRASGCLLLPVSLRPSFLVGKSPPALFFSSLVLIFTRLPQAPFSPLRYELLLICEPLLTPPLSPLSTRQINTRLPLNTPSLVASSCFKTLPDCSCWQTRHTHNSSANSYANQLMRSRRCLLCLPECFSSCICGAKLKRIWAGTQNRGCVSFCDCMNCFQRPGARFRKRVFKL